MAFALGLRRPAGDAPALRLPRSGRRCRDPYRRPDPRSTSSRRTWRRAGQDRSVQAEIAESNPLLEIGGQFGKAVGLGGAIRTRAHGQARPEAAGERHASRTRAAGSCWRRCSTRSSRSTARRTADLRRIGGVSAAQPVVSPDLALRMAAEARRPPRTSGRSASAALDDLADGATSSWATTSAALITSDRDAHGRRRAGLSGGADRQLPRPRDRARQGVTSLTEDGLRWLVGSWQRAGADRRRSALGPPAGRRARSGRQPDRRILKTFAFDPSAGRSVGNRLTLSLPYEPLDPGPSAGRSR